MLFCFLLAVRFQLGAYPLAGLWVVPPSHFRVGFRLFISPPRHDSGLRGGVDVDFFCLRACVLLRLTFLRLAPPHATLAVRGSFLTMVCLITTRFLPRPPATLAVRGRFFMVV